MSKKDAYRKMTPDIVKYMNRYVSEILHEPTEELQRRAEEIYERMYAETPEIGGSENPMADNLYQFMTFCAYDEASGHRIGESSVAYLSKWMLDDKRILGRIVNLNHRLSVRLMKLLFGKIADTTARKKAAGEWGNTWSITDNSQEHPEGVSYILRGCPLLAFAKAHGYEKMLPRFCAIDHESAALMHGKLIRYETEATGSSCCDYWFVGDRSDTARKYAGLPKI